MVATIAVIAEKKKKKFSDRSDHSDHMETTFPAIAATTITEIGLFISSSAIVVAFIAAIATIAGKWFPYDRYDHCDR